MTQPYHVGQELWIYDINARGCEPKRGTVTKVGRKLVTVNDGYAAQTYRVDNGRRNDNYRHQWLVTDEQRALNERHAAALETLRAARVEIGFGAELDLDTLEKLAAVIRDAA